MADIKYDPTNVLDAGWQSDCKQWHEVEALAVVAVGQEVRRLRHVMSNLLNAVLSLGGDGIHDVIKHEAARIRRAKKIAANRRKRARAAKAAKVTR